MSSRKFTSARWSAARTTFLGALLFGLAACTAVEPVPPSRPANVQNLEARARSEEQNGNLSAAANLYMQLAASVTGTLRSGYLLDAARLSIENADYASARRQLTDARAGADRDQQQLNIALLARLEVEQGRPQPALDMLAQLQQPIGVPVLREAAAARGRALFRLGRPAEAVRALVEREVWLEDSRQIIANQRLIWDGFREPSAPSTLAPTGDRIIDGWLALAPLARLGDNAPDLRRELLDWRETYTDHPAAGGLLAELLAAQRASGFPAQIALLLPLTSSARLEALALRDGFIAAHLRGTRGASTNVRIYDTAAGAAEAYLRAQLEGADFIVGPLLRPDVDQVIAQAGFVPTLALNFAQVETAFSGSFYQFALSPTDEARVVAQYAAAAGATTAVALVPSTARGYELRDIFRAEFEAHGGTLLDFIGYDTNAQDFSGPITTLFNINRSVQRHRRLAANLGVPVQFEPRRRQDVDAIFLAADSRMGRFLMPQLRVNSVGDIPTYATSDIYQPGGTARYNDLNGVLFADAPAVLAPDQAAAAMRSEMQVYWPQRDGQVRFYGMGFDAYQLVGALYEGGASAWPLVGMSGDLRLAADGKIHRTLPLGQFRDGRPVALEVARPEPRENQELVGFECMRLREGQQWETVAASYLESHGLVVLARGYRCRLGELDLVCRDDATLVVVEVRARRKNAFVPAVQSISHQKRARIIQATRHFLMRRAEWYSATLRFDVVAIDGIDTAQPSLNWIKRAFEAS